MKIQKLLPVLLLVFVLSLLFVVPVLAQGEVPEVPGLDLTVAQLFWVGLITSGLVVVLRFVLGFLAKQQIDPPDWVLQLIVYIVSGAVAYLWFPPAVPSLPQIPSGAEVPEIVNAYNAFVAALISSLSGFFVTAHLLYKAFIKHIRDQLAKKFYPARFDSYPQ